MSSESTRPSAQDDLQFDRAVHADVPNGGPATGLTCAICSTPLRTEYFQVGGQPACAACASAAERANENAARQGLRPLVFARALVFGLVAAVAGAALYYAVAALTGWEIALVAIAIGFMVGFAVNKASGSAGGRRFQWLAAILTYFAVGLAYSPFAFNSPSEVSVLLIFALPVIYIANSMPSGLLSAIIILVGMQQAWKMTARASLPITGPYKVGSPPTPSPA
ncbi:MAG TPA: hypothetical protein VJ650_01030 [Gemmatimonadaceae bacterium]|nr:hypothetical protein [Gemmatimonadaceae bacterium]